MKRGKRDGTTLVFAGVEAQPRAAMEKAGLVEMIGAANFVGDLTEGLGRAREVLR